MNLRCGIIGLPNVGKSTLFNALTSSVNAESSNYPFCTIEPNFANVKVFDDRLVTLSKIAKSAKIIQAHVNFVDIAGLVKGASHGDGLGNKFLSHIRGVDALLHVVRCFEDINITHVYNDINPIRDIEIIETELILSDLELITRRLDNLKKKSIALDKAIENEILSLELLKDHLSLGKSARSFINVNENFDLKQLQLLSLKPLLYACNVSEKDLILSNKSIEQIKDRCILDNADHVLVSSKIELDIALLDNIVEKEEFSKSLGITENALNKIIKKVYSILGLKSFFTLGVKEARAWTYVDGITAQKAAGIIHTDFQKGFIRAEVIGYDDYILCGNELKAKELGKMRLEGKEYKICDGDIIHFRFNI